MGFEYLDSESEEKLKEILGYKDLGQKAVSGYAVDFLVKNGYLVGCNAGAFGDSEPCYLISGVTQKGKSYFELKKKYEDEAKKLSRREWKIAIVSAIIGAFIGHIPTIFSVICKIISNVVGS